MSKAINNQRAIFLFLRISFKMRLSIGVIDSLSFTTDSLISKDTIIAININNHHNI